MKIYTLVPPSFEPIKRLPRELITDRIEEADAIVVGTRMASHLLDVLPRATRVRWIHALAAGVDPFPFDLLRRTDITVTNSRGLYADALSEFVIAAMLWFAKDLRRMTRNQDARRWDPLTVERLEGQTAGIIGFGGIGRAVARRAEALGMPVMAARRRSELGDPTIDDVVAASDYVIVTAPLTPSTRGLVSAARIARMKETAVLINVSRGALVDEGALIAALRANKIKGAALDVYTIEPLPPQHPLWQLDNVLVSPHSADHTADSHDRAMTFFLENVRRFERGDALENIVNKDEHY